MANDRAHAIICGRMKRPTSRIWNETLPQKGACQSVSEWDRADVGAISEDPSFVFAAYEGTA